MSHSPTFEASLSIQRKDFDFPSVGCNQCQSNQCLTKWQAFGNQTQTEDLLWLICKLSLVIVEKKKKKEIRMVSFLVPWSMIFSSYLVPKKENESSSVLYYMYSKFLSPKNGWTGVYVKKKIVGTTREKINIRDFHNQGCACRLARSVLHIFWALLNVYFFSKCLSFLCVTHKKPSAPLIPKSFTRKIFGASKQQKKSRNFDMTAFDSRLKTNGHMGAPPPKPPSLPKFVHSNCHFADFKADFAPLKTDLRSWFLDSSFPKLSILR